MLIMIHLTNCVKEVIGNFYKKKKYRESLKYIYIVTEGL